VQSPITMPMPTCRKQLWEVAWHDNTDACPVFLPSTPGPVVKDCLYRHAAAHGCRGARMSNQGIPQDEGRCKFKLLLKAYQTHYPMP
jgi:hypothetical protein